MPPAPRTVEPLHWCRQPHARRFSDWLGHGVCFRDNWTELDIWNYIAGREQITFQRDDMDFAHDRKCVVRDEVILAA